MSKKFSLFILSVFLFSIIASPSVLSHFPEAHLYSELKAVQDANFQSPLLDLAKKYPDYVHAGSLSADCFVIFYLSSSQRKNYVASHTRSSVDKCFQLAGNEEKYRAFCSGWALHLNEDIHSHEEYTPNTIKKYLSTNLFMHPVAERYVIKQLEKSNDPLMDQVNLLTPRILDPLATDPKLQQIINEATGVDATDACNIVAIAMRGSRYDSENIWKSKSINIPNIWWYIAFIPLILLIINLILLAWKGRGFWKWFLIVGEFIILIFFVLALISLFLGTTYIWYNAIVDYGLTPFVKVDNWQKYVDETVQANMEYLRTGKLDVYDASGLDHYDPLKGEIVEGELTKAEKGGKIVFGLFFVIGLAVNGLLNYFAFRKRRKK